MTVDFRSVVLSKGDEAERLDEAQLPSRSPRTILLGVVLAVASGLCAVAWIWG